jgi:hypothetical protein
MASKKGYLPISANKLKTKNKRLYSILECDVIKGVMSGLNTRG